MNTAIDNSEDVIDSRDIIDRLRHLDPESEDIDEREEYAALAKLSKECEDYVDDWKHGETLIRESYWEDYVRELLDDCGYLPKSLPSWIEIDWEATASNVAADYMTVDFGGVTYYVRCS